MIQLRFALCLLLATSTFASSLSHAEPRVPSLAHARGRKAAGATVMVLAILNLALATAYGIAYAVQISRPCPQDFPCFESYGVPESTIGASTFVGAVLSAVGIPLWISGANEARRVAAPQVWLRDVTTVEVRF